MYVIDVIFVTGTESVTGRREIIVKLQISSIMDKYEEALAKARAGKSLDEIFPEMKESEDERVRKALLEYFGKQCDTATYNGIYCYEIYAWLKKQKEQKSAECIPDSVKFDEGFKTGRELGRREGVESVKPAEWSEEDSDMICEIIDHCIAIPYIGGTLHLSDERKKELKTFLKSLRPQPHTVSIKNATKYGNLEYERGVKDGIHSEKSRQWKPSEEQMSALNYFIKLWGNSDDQLEYTKIFNTVKSLRDDLEKQM